MKNQETLLNAIETLESKITGLTWQVNDIKALIGKPDEKEILPKIKNKTPYLCSFDDSVIKILSKGNYESKPALISITNRNYSAITDSLQRIRNFYQVETRDVNAVGYKRVYRIKTGADGQPVKKSA